MGKCGSSFVIGGLIRSDTEGKGKKRKEKKKA